MKKLLSTLCLFPLLSLNCQAQQPFDAGVSVGFMPSDDRTYGMLRFNTIVGRTERITHRVGLEYLYYDRTIDKALDVKLDSPTLIAAYEFELQQTANTNIFFGAGIGVQFHDLSSSIGTLDESESLYSHLCAGVRYQLSQSTSLEFTARRLFFEDFDLFGVQNLKQDHQWGIELGLRIRF